jgi:hypothetical protein
MGILQKTCMLYVDYTNLVLSLSRIPYFDVSAVLDMFQEQARQRFYIQDVRVYSPWMLDTVRKRFEEQRISCDQITGSETTIVQAIHDSIVANLVSPLAADVYILIAGDTRFTELLNALRLARNEVLLWTYVMPDKQDRQRATWQRILPPTERAKTPWARSIMLQAVALATDHKQVDAETPLAISKLQTHLIHNKAFRSATDAWITIAISEQILLPAKPIGRARSPRGYVVLNREHRLVQRALELREHIMMTLSSLLVDREWVAFNVLEKAMRTIKQLADDQRTRQSWIEVLINENVLIAMRVPQPGSQHMVTTLRLNRNHPQALVLQRYQRQNLYRLIFTMNSFLERRGTDWQAVAHLLRSLTGPLTRVEARSILQAALRQGIITLDTMKNPRESAHDIAIAVLNHNHNTVQETLYRRDRTILDCAYLLKRQPHSVLSLTQLEEQLSHRQDIPRVEAHFWISLLLSEEFLLVRRPTRPVENPDRMIYLNEHDPIVTTVLHENHP